MKTRVIYIVWVIGVLFTACQEDFNPIADSSVRTMDVYLDPSDVLDNFLVAQEDTFILGYHDSIPADMLLRITTYCYHSDGRLHSKQTKFSHNLAPFHVSISHVDTLKEYSICCVADFVHKTSEDVTNYYWVQMRPNELSSLYMFHCNIDNNIGNHVSVVRWMDFGTEQIGPLTFIPETYNGYLRLINFQNLNYVYFHWRRYAAINIWDGTPDNYIQYLQEIEFYPHPTMHDSLVSIYLANGNDSLYYKAKTRFISTTDSASYQKKMKHRPFVGTLDCKKLQITNLTYY